MKRKTFSTLQSLLTGATLLVGASLAVSTHVSAQLAATQIPVPAAEPLAWDSIMKESNPKVGDPTANFTFSVTNISGAEVVITDVKTSCGCTVAKLPGPTPWHMAPGISGDIGVTVNLAGKTGTVYKTITVSALNHPAKVLTVKVNLPENPMVMRMKNSQIAHADRQAVFKGACAECHVDKGKGKMGKALYVESCGICHESKMRDSAVPDLHTLKHPTDYAYWKQWISHGREGSMMPAFSMAEGGPLTDEQIDSLAQVLGRAFPSTFTAAAPTPGPAANANGVQLPAKLN